MIGKLIDKLVECSIHIELTGQDQLKLQGDVDAIPGDLIAEIRANRDQLVRYLKDLQTSENFEIIPAFVSAESYPVSSAQRRIWLLSQFDGANTAYNMPGAYQLEGQLDKEILASCFRTLIQRHESLRTIFREDRTGEVRQFVLSPETSGFELLLEDLRDGDASRQSMESRLALDFSQPFNLETGPLVRAHLYQLPGDRWIFTYVMHHIISDGWSTVVLIRELLALYNAFTRGEKNPLTPLRIQYRDYTQWQKTQLQTEGLNVHKQYWMDQFAGALPILELTGDRPRPAIRTWRGGSVNARLDAGDLERLRALCLRHQGTIFMGLLSLLYAMLYRYTGNEDIIVGTPVAGREHADLEDQIGFYVNTLAIRARFDPADSYGQLLEKVKQLTLEAYEHQQYPFDQLVDELRLQRDMSRSALFDIMLVLQNLGGPDQQPGEEYLGQAKVTAFGEGGQPVSKFDLTFGFAETAEGMEMNIEYNSDIYDKESVQRMTGHFKGMMAAAVAEPERSIDTLQYLQKKEQLEILQDFNDTSMEYEKDITIVELFERQAIANPQNIALIVGQNAMTYAELNQRANRLAHYLRTKYQIGVGDRIGILLERSEWLVIALLGVLKSGAAYVPMDPAYPRDRIDFMQQDSDPRLILGNDELAGFQTEENNHSPQDPVHLNHPKDLAYVIYTSGSTGRPKGVMIDHASVNAFVQWAEKEFGHAAFNTVFAATSVCFDLSVFEIFYTLSTGKNLRLLPNALSIPDYLLVDENILLNTVPSVVGTLLSEQTDLSRVTVLNMAGEPIPRKYLETLDLRKMEIRNLYGPTESTTYSTIYSIPHAGNVLIGRPIGNTRAYILDRQQQLVPVGVIGEIWLAGDGLARGYLNQPEMTKRKFLADPFRPGERMYRTGDLGRWHTDGNIEYMGRMDHQVKIRGYRIELGEVENEILACEGIESCAVVAHDQEDYKILVAYIARTTDASFLQQQLYAHCRKTLPEYMVPSFIIELPQMPLTSNGKIDRKRLPSPIAGPDASEYAAPRNLTEERIVQLWEDILDTNGIGINDNFFELGGHSLKATILANRFRKEFNAEVRAGDILLLPTLREQAAWIAQQQKTGYDPITKAPEADSYPISEDQRRIWLASQFEESAQAYHIPLSMTLEGPLNPDIFKKAIHLLIERHETLRTVFPDDPWSGDVRQVILNKEQSGFTVDEEDLRGRTEEAQKDYIAGYIDRESWRPFDLAKGPLVRAGLFRLKEELCIFFYNIHHIVIDQLSLEILARDVTRLYEALLKGQDPMLPPLTLQYRDYTAWQAQRIAQGKDERERKYWMQQLGGDLSILDIGPSHIRPQIKTYRGSVVFRYWEQSLIKKLENISRTSGATMFMSLLTGLNTLLYRYTGLEDIVLGTILSGRTHESLMDQAGFYVNTVPLRTRFKGEHDFTELLGLVKKVAINAYDYQDYSFDRMVDELDIPEDPSRSPIFDIMINYQPGGMAIGLGDENLHTIRVHRYTTATYDAVKYDLAFFFTHGKAGELDLVVEYNSDIFPEEFMTRFLDHYRRILEAAADNPRTPIDQLDYMDQEEKTRLSQGSRLGENTRVYVLDPFETPVPVEAIGEIVLSGDEIPHELWNLRELATGRWVPDPFRPGEQMYRTGRLGRRKMDGAVEVTDRSVRQTKKRSLPEEKEYIAPRNETETRLTRIWENILGRGRVGMKDRFFDLGGHSLKIMRLASQIYKEFEVKLTLKELFENPVLEQQARLIEEAQSFSFSTIPIAPEQDSYPLSSAQKRIWLLSQLEGANAAYCIPGIFEWAGLLDEKILLTCFQTLITRHQSLRTVFRDDEHGQLRQFIQQPADTAFNLVTTDLRDENDPQAALDARINGKFETTFDLINGPLIHAALYRVADNRWIFVCMMHHIVSDGWSMDILGKELLALYNAYSNNLPDPLPPLRIQYKDYAVWQQQQIGGDGFQTHKAYWLKQFQGELPLVEVPGDHPHPPVKTFNGGVVVHEIDAAALERLNILLSEDSDTLFMGLLTVLTSLLYFYTGQNDIILGCPASGRTHIDLENQIGFYANALALRIGMDGSENFRELLARVKTRSVDAYEHQAYPFDELLETLNIQREAGRNALFDIFMDLHRIENDRLPADGQAEGLKATEYASPDHRVSKFDLTFMFTEVNGHIYLSLEYNSDLYEQTTARRLAAGFDVLLRSMVNAPSIPIDRLNYIPEQDLTRLLSDFQGPKTIYPETQVLGLFEQQVAKDPGKIALIYQGDQMTYGMLQEQSDLLARHLVHRLGTKPGDSIAILLTRSEKMIVAILGILKASCAYVPIDPDLPAERIKYILSDTSVKVLITQSDFLFNLGQYEGALFAIDLQLSGLEMPPEPVERREDPNDPAYVIYTSGSTGKPKGCVLTQGNLYNYIQWANSYYFDRQAPHFGLFSALSFDLTITSIFCPLTTGGCLTIYDQDEDIVNILSHMFGGQTGIDSVKLTPSHIGLMSRLGLRSEISCVIVGGEEVTPQHIKILKQINPAVKIYNEYGPTETTVGCIVAPLQEDAPILIGRPIANTGIYIVNNQQALCPILVPGEILIGGAGLAQGYLNRPDLTTQRFLPHPWAPDQRLYRTGDLGRWLDDGNIEFLGRCDQQVKIRGYRIEPGEIEHAIAQYEEVDGVTVLVRQSQDKELVAYLTADKQLSMEGLRSYLQRILPAYMIPAHFIQVAEFPLTPNGKLDKKQLLEMGGSELSTAAAYLAPGTQIEIEVVQVYEEVLKRRPIGMKDDFFMLGGDSIKSIQIVSRLKQRGYTVSIRDIMRYPVLGQLSAHVKPSVRTIGQDVVEGRVPLGPIQQYFFEKYGDNPDHYNQSVLLRFRGRLSEEGLRAALARLVEHHDALRMQYRREGTEWIQENRGLEQGYTLEVQEGKTLAELGEAADRLQAAIGIDKGPLFRAALWRMEEDRLLLVCHHLVVDGVSWRILMDDLKLFYEQHQSGQPLTTALKTDSFLHWQQRLREHAQGRWAEKENTYWAQLESEPVDPVFLDHTSGSNLTRDVLTCTFLLDERQTELLQTACYKAYRTEINDILLTALGLSLEETWGMRKILIGLEGHGREQIIEEIDTSRTVGWFTTIYPVLLDMSGSSEMIPRLIDVKESLHRVPNKGIGYGILRYIGQRDYRLEPGITFNYLGDFGGSSREQQQQDNGLFSFSGEYHGRKLPKEFARTAVLEVSGMVVNGQLRLSIDYSREQYETATIQQLSSVCRQKLETLIGILSKEEQTRLSPVDLTFKGLSVEQLQKLNASL